ncbi:zinc ribbon domain-containing protein [uncultured Oscillibacter sp.]|uniref:zinc ribbon domain-containing protein n=1 Tax=uncultured Oscillibacter sp. TaxID=876091 RepID=UPI0025F925E7|nr:zinc ribbon domain-containing protein [uncultured Oscillibacter sp.]
MEIKDAILELRKSLGLSQDNFAKKLFVTRQAVSRWETGETVPRIDTLKLIAQTFHVPMDQLLGHPSEICQSCGMILSRDGDRGTERDGSPSGEYCAYCYQNGGFTQAITMEEQVEQNLLALEEWNQATGLHLTEAEARAQLLEFLPTLKRWRAE